MIAVFASSNKTDSATVDHEANRLVFMTVLLIELHKILIPDPCPTPHVNFKEVTKKIKKFTNWNRKKIIKIYFPMLLGFPKYSQHP